jgi:hypothetical protein
MATSGATFQVTGVQLEKGATATSFDVRDYGRELMMCQRYYATVAKGGTSNPMFLGQCDTTTQASSFYYYPVPMRAAPSLDATSGSNYYRISVANVDYYFTTWATYAPTSTCSNLYTTGISGVTAGRCGGFLSSNASAYLGLSAEL